MITSYSPETWDLMNRGTDSDTGLPCCHVRRVTRDAITRSTVWRLIRRPNGWYNVGQYIGSLGGYRPAPERYGVKLSGSRTDLTLFEFAERGYSTGWSV